MKATRSRIELRNVLDLPMRDGNVKQRHHITVIVRVLDLPMRDGNVSRCTRIGLVNRFGSSYEGWKLPPLLLREDGLEFWIFL